MSPVFRWSVWLNAKALPFFVPKGLAFHRVVSLLARSPEGGFGALPVQAVVDTVIWATKHPWLMRDRRCLRQGILAFRYLKATGHEPVIHFGIEPVSLKDEKVRAHCWVTVNGTPVMSDRLPGMKTIFMFPNTEDKTSNVH